MWGELSRWLWETKVRFLITCRFRVPFHGILFLIWPSVCWKGLTQFFTSLISFDLWDSRGCILHATENWAYWAITLLWHSRVYEGLSHRYLRFTEWVEFMVMEKDFLWCENPWFRSDKRAQKWFGTWVWGCCLGVLKLRSGSFHRRILLFMGNWLGTRMTRVFSLMGTGQFVHLPFISGLLLYVFVACSTSYSERLKDILTSVQIFFYKQRLSNNLTQVIRLNCSSWMPFFHI